MPVLSRFYGIIIRMYFLPKEHNPPHVHVIYQDETFSISIKELAIIDGDETRRQERYPWLKNGLIFIAMNCLVCGKHRNYIQSNH